MNYLNELVSNEEVFLKYLNEKFPFVSKSNFFLRDLQYGITYYFKNKGKKLKLTQTESLALEFASHLVEANHATTVSKNTWRLNYSFIPEVENKEEEIGSNNDND